MRGGGGGMEERGGEQHPHLGHGLDARANANVDEARLDGRGDVGDRLKAARALAVQRRDADLFREAAHAGSGGGGGGKRTRAVCNRRWRRRPGPPTSHAIPRATLGVPGREHGHAADGGATTGREDRADLNVLHNARVHAGLVHDTLWTSAPPPRIGVQSQHLVRPAPARTALERTRKTARRRSSGSVSLNAPFLARVMAVRTALCAGGACGGQACR